MTKLYCFILQFLLTICIRIVLSTSVSFNKVSITKNDALKYLETFGYVEERGPLGKEHDNSWVVDNRVTEGLKAFQRLFNLPVTGLLDVNTTRLMLSPRCGNKDFARPIIRVNTTTKRRVRRYSVDKKSRWSKSNITFKVISFPSSGLSKPKVRSIFQKALNMWARVTNLDFHEVRNYYENADIVIEFGKLAHGDAIPFDGPGKVLAHAYFPHPMEVMSYSRSGDAHFDDDEHWTDGTVGKSLLAVAVHELGHSMGMGHSLVEEAIMYPFYIPPVTGRLSLQDDDIQGIQSVYGKPAPGKYIPPVDELPEELPTPPPTPTPKPGQTHGPDLCNTSVDAVIMIRGLELFVFKNEWQWRVGWSKTISNWYSYEHSDGPQLYTYYWPALPDNLGGIDTGIETESEKIYYFRGRRFWILVNNEGFANGFTTEGRPLTDLGLPATLEKVDTIFMWGYNKDTYIFAGQYYWKFKEGWGTYGRVVPAPRYPRLIKNVWFGLPENIDAAYTGLDGDTYFFKGNKYYSFNNYQMRVRPGYPKPAKLSWLGCKLGDDYKESVSSSKNKKIFIYPQKLEDSQDLITLENGFKPLTLSAQTVFCAILFAILNISLH